MLKNPKDLKQGLSKLMKEHHDIQKELSSLKKEKASGAGKDLEEKIEEKNAVKILLSQVDIGPDEAKNLIFQLIKKHRNLIVALATVQENKVVVSIGLGPELVKAANFTAKGLIKEISADIHGGGGGQDHFATAGGKNVGGVVNAFEKIRNIVSL